MLEYIKQANRGIQIVAVGDMAQKIYDKTTLQVVPFMDQFLENYVSLEFTQCFRLSAGIAAMLGGVWGKKIIGVNPRCKVETMKKRDVVDFLKEQNPSDVLCLGARHGDLSDTLNVLERVCREKYNKNTIFASISDNDSGSGYAVEPRADCGIFTTFDSSKGLERKVCVVFDFTEDYWLVRIRKPQVMYEIMRNIFCVAASRGKDRIIFVEGETALLPPETLATPTGLINAFEDMNISTMFDFKYKEDIEECFSYLSCERDKTKRNHSIDINAADGFIDLSPCIGIFQEASYFEGYDLEKDLELLYETDKDRSKVYQREFDQRGVQGKILVLTAMETHLNRYVQQVETPFISDKEEWMIHQRLAEEFSLNETVQVDCSIPFYYDEGYLFYAKGLADVVRDDTVFEVKFCAELTHEHFLQCACHMIALNLPKGVLWNIKTDTRYDIRIKDRRKFLDAVARAITKQYVSGYKYPKNLYT